MTTHAITDGKAAELEAFAHQLIPELAAAPFYIMPRAVSDCRRDPNYRTAAMAFPAWTMPYLVREQLITEGRYRGMGNTVMFVEPADDDVDAIVLHECAHLLPVSDPLPEPKSELFIEAMVAQERRQLKEPRREQNDKPLWSPCHGASFIRFAIHLHARAWDLGREISLGAMRVAGPRYDLSPHWQYSRALGDEPRRMRNATFDEIARAAMPKAFRKLFHEDYQRWLGRRNSKMEDRNEFRA